MRVLSKSPLTQFCIKHADAETPLMAWYEVASKAEWADPADIKATYASASILADNRVVFNIGGNKYRLVVRISYAFQRVMVKFIGTHAEYDDIDATEVGKD